MTIKNGNQTAHSNTTTSLTKTPNLRFKIHNSKLFKSFGLNSETNANSLRSHLTKSALGTFLLKVFSTGFAFLTSLFLARLLGAKGYGAYAYALSLVGFINVFVVFGLPTLTTRQVSIYNSKKEWCYLKGFLQWSNRFVLVNALMATAILFVATFILQSHLNQEMLLPFRIAILLLPFLGLLQLKEVAIQGLKHIIMGQISSSLVRSLVFLAILTTTYFSNLNLNPSRAIEFNITAVIIALVFSTYILKNYLPPEINLKKAKYKTKFWIKSAIPLLLSGVLALINSQTDIIMLGTIKGAYSTGIYAVATRVATLIIFILTSVNAAIAPTVAELYSKRELRRLQNVITKSAIAVFFLSLPIAFFLIFKGKLALWLFGKEFVAGTGALAILSIGQLINASAGSVGLILAMTGHEKDVAVGVGVSAVVNVILNAMLIPHFGAKGAAIATSTSMIMWNIILGIYVYKRTRLDPTALGVLKKK